MAPALPPHPLKSLYDSLDISSTGKILNVPLVLKQKYLKMRNYADPSKPDFEGHPIQLSILFPQKRIDIIGLSTSIA
jgi:hypothetical protein